MCQTSAHTHYSGYTINQLKPICELIFDCCHDAERHHTAVFEKYSDKKYKQAATFVQDQINAGIKLDYRSFDPEKVDMAKLLPDDYVEMQRLLIHEGMV